MDNVLQESKVITAISFFYLIIGAGSIFLGYKYEGTYTVGGGVVMFSAGIGLLMRRKVGRFFALIVAWFNIILGIIVIAMRGIYPENILTVVIIGIFAFIVVVLQKKKYYAEFK